MSHSEGVSQWSSRHEHVYQETRPNARERRTLIVVAITAATMVAEIAAGLVYGSMALLADGLHMASHAVALGIAAFAYRYARRHASDPRFSFGTGKVNSLAGFSGAVLLGVFAVGMGVESLERFFEPVPIVFDKALVVAVLGLLVNGASVFILGSDHTHSHDGSHEPAGHAHSHDGSHEPAGHAHSHDHNYRSAYFHVLADALTSVLAIFALLAAKYFGQHWLDPLMGIVGALLVARWSVGLMRQSSETLLDHQAPDEVLEAVREAVEASGGCVVVDLHVWSIGPGRRAAIIALEANEAQPLDTYRKRVPTRLGIEHLTIEVSGRARSRARQGSEPMLGDQPEQASARSSDPPSFAGD